MLTERRRRVLKAIIDEFIEYAHPVGSKLLIKKYDMPYSSATIRNEMAKLEEAGYLEKAHTSSGRIPSEEGYRYYIKFLFEEDDREITSIIPRGKPTLRMTRLERLVDVCYQVGMPFDWKMNQIIQLLSEVTEQTVFYLGPSLRHQVFTKMNLVSVSSTEALLLLVIDETRMETKPINIQSLHEYETFEYFINFLNERFQGVRLIDFAHKFEETMEQMGGAHVPGFEHIFREIGRLLEVSISKTVYFRGLSFLINDESIKSIDDTRKILNFFEDPHLLEWFDGKEIGIDIHVGEEIRHPLFSQFSLVRSTFEVPRMGLGTICILGSKRMHYQGIVQLLTFVSQFINHEGGIDSE